MVAGTASRKWKGNWEGCDSSNSQNLLLVTHFLQEGHTSPNNAIILGPIIQIHEPIRGILIQPTTGGVALYAWGFTTSWDRIQRAGFLA